MALRDRAVIELTNNGTTGEFHFIGPEVTFDLERKYLMGEGGQKIREAGDVFVPGIDVEDGGSRGYVLDGGLGVETITLAFEIGHDLEEYNDTPIQWGDGSSGTNKWDATGAGPQTLAEVFVWWARNARTDSYRTQAELHLGEWTDGSINGDAGIFGEPMTVAVENVTFDRDANSPSSIDGRLELTHIISLTELEGGETDPLNAIPPL